MPGINTVTMNHFRGATGATTVDLGDGPLVVIHGGNGTGKSTIADAINLICNRTGGSLKDRSSTNLTTDIPSAGMQGVSVSLTDGKETWKWDGRFAGQGIGAVKPSEPAPPPLFVLRRSNLLKLTEAAPAQRYSELGRLIDIPKVEANEKALRAILAQAQTALAQAQAVYDARHADLNNLWVAAGSPLPDAETWAMKASAIDENDLALLKRLDDLIASHESVKIGLETLQTAEQAELTKVQNVAECQDSLTGYMAQAGLKQGDVDTLAVLEATARYLKTAAKATTCPACQQQVDLETLRAKVTARLEGLHDLSNLIRALTDAQAALVRAKAETAWCRKDVIAGGKDLATKAQAAHIEAVDWLNIQWNQYAKLAAAPAGAADETLLEDVNYLLTALDRIYNGNVTHLIGKPVIEGLGVDRNILTGRVELAKHVRNVLKALLTVTEARNTAQGQFNAWNDVCNIVTTQRQNFVNDLLHAVMEDCGALYSRIHPDEAISLTNVEIGGAGTGRSLEMMANLDGHAGRPQAYLSDSHLDTLGFCFWLAAVKHYSQGNAVVMLDDVFTSADEEHQKRILGLLQEQTLAENNGPTQIILLTHSNAWRDAARAEAEAGQPVHLIELAPWTYDNGIHA